MTVLDGAKKSFQFFQRPYSDVEFSDNYMILLERMNYQFDYEYILEGDCYGLVKPTIFNEPVLSILTYQVFKLESNSGMRELIHPDILLVQLTARTLEKEADAKSIAQNFQAVHSKLQGFALFLVFFSFQTHFIIERAN